MVTVRTVIGLAAAENWCIYQMDVYNAFLQDELTEKVFMELPKCLKVANAQPIVFEAGITARKITITLLECNVKLTTTFEDESEEELHPDVTQYQRMIGKLLYLTITRPDIAYTVQTLSQFLQRPKAQHWQAVIRVLRYIKNQLGLGLLMSSQKKMKLTVFCDADWAACPNTRR
ncbi:uncharacterized mitochondrial protein AtMg00810-like [Solanum stenotomum]|uniref:uncharacterized mitochondrial protein AtMg00810-like n=1 Tax=Solanum stenotomum TaxID=172797 RepID=UPI0020D08D0C|nr:uncharacterized mitochondrial protein AtMg00810-like [Solanum stenotomum]